MQDGLDEQAVARIAGDVDAMLDLLDASSLAATLRDQDTRAYFEMPFNWDWNGVPVHGAIDLVYQSEGSWRLIDFKTDNVRGRTLAEAAESYLPQLALYAAALERAIGQRPAASLLFLRTGESYTPSDAAPGPGSGRHPRSHRRRSSAGDAALRRLGGRAGTDDWAVGAHHRHSREVCPAPRSESGT